jgi:RimJ/RimL family protein N-acetyltransferase
MSSVTEPTLQRIWLRPWAADDLPLLELLMGDPRMTEHLGGPEPPEKLVERNERYARIGGSGTGAMFVICEGSDATGVGSIGYWEREWQGEPVWETGWSVVPEAQGRGIATRAIALLLENVAADGVHRSLHAYPGVDNAPSNAVCRKAGMTLIGQADVEYPPGHPLRVNDWEVRLPARPR